MRHKTLDRSTLREHAAQFLFGQTTARHESFGLEIELFPVHWPDRQLRPHPAPIHRTEHRTGASLPYLEQFAHAHAISTKLPTGSSSPTSGRRASFTFEPGGQVEFSSAPHHTPAAAFQETTCALDALAQCFADHQLHLISLGANPWHRVEEIGLQTEADRYRCMDAVFQSIGEFGRRMMRQTCAIQVNLDFGPPDRMPLRWRGAHLLAPLALATFACSPVVDERVTGNASFRGHIWRYTDRTRCGIPSTFRETPHANPLDQYLDFAMDARLILVRWDTAWEPQIVPLPFRRWMEEGLKGFYPTLDDWTYHLTTLFPEVRPKGHLELRSADTQFRPFWSVPLTWWAALLCDDSALEQVVHMLSPYASKLEERMSTAASRGLSDEILRDRSTAVFRIAADALPRFPADFFSQDMMEAFQAFGERYTMAGRAPADDLLERIERQGLNHTMWELSHPERNGGNRTSPLFLGEGEAEHAKG